MNRKRIGVVLLCLSGGLINLFGTEITLDMATWMERALPRHPALREAEVAVQARQLQTEERFFWEDPELRIGADERPGLRDETSVSLRFPIPNLWRESALSQREDSRLELAQAEHEAALRMAREDLGRLYLEAVAAQKLSRFARERMSNMEREIARASMLLDRQRLTHGDLLEMKVEFADAVVELSEIEAGLAITRARLFEYLPEARNHDTLSLEPVSIELEGDLPDPEQIRQRVLRRDPELVARLAAIRAASAAVAAERARRIPFPTFIQGGWTRDRFRDQDEWEARIGISLPLFSWSRGTDPRDRAELMVSENEAQFRRDEIARLSDRLYREFITARRHKEHLLETVQRVLMDLDRTLEHPRAIPEPDQRMDLVDDRFRLQRDLVRAELDLNTATWALHTFLLNWL